MNVYVVTAANKYFWQKLAVKSHNQFIAARKFRAYLTSRSAKREEKYEWGEGHLSPDERSPLRDYVYLFDDDDIKEADWTDRLHHVSVKVEMIGSGGNG